MRYMRALIILSITWLIKDRIGLHSVRPSTSHKCLHVFVMSRSVIQGVRITQQEIQTDIQQYLLSIVTVMFG